MTFVLAVFVSLALFAFGYSTAHASSPQWDTTGSYTIDFTCISGCVGTYEHTLNVTSADLDTGDISGDGHFNGNTDVSWDMTGSVSEADMVMTIVYNNINLGYTLETEGMIVGDGTLSGYATSSGGQVFSYESTAGSATFVPHGAITAPEEDAIVTGLVDLAAWYHDEDPEIGDVDTVAWAVREGTCEVDDDATVGGNVAGFDDAYDWDGNDFSAEFDSTGHAPGMYCFIFNPIDDDGQEDFRATQEFFVAESHVNGGGQIIEEVGNKRKDWHKISFGGWTADIGELVGEWEVNFHNVTENEGMLDKGKFHGSEFTEFVVTEGDSDTCEEATRIRVDGSFNGESGYHLILRGGDSDNAASKTPDDTVRFELFDGEGTRIYDTIEDSDIDIPGWDADEFTNESSCLGGARTGLDAGNLSIIDNS